jgi:hypothetical protein
MRAREFTINVPINIKINGDNEPDISVDQDKQDDELLTIVEPPQEKDTSLPQDAIFVPPLQQKLELMKKAAGKHSNVIDQITADDDHEAS